MSQVKLHSVTTNNINCSPSLLLSMIVTSSESGTGLLSFRNGGTFTVTSNGTLQYHTHATAAAAHSTSQVVDANDMVISTNPDNSTTGNVAVIQLIFSSMAQQPGHLPHTAISNSTPTVNRSMSSASLCYSWCQLCTGVRQLLLGVATRARIARATMQNNPVTQYIHVHSMLWL